MNFRDNIIIYVAHIIHFIFYITWQMTIDKVAPYTKAVMRYP